MSKAYLCDKDHLFTEPGSHSECMSTDPPLYHHFQCCPECGADFIEVVRCDECGGYDEAALANCGEHLSDMTN